MSCKSFILVFITFCSITSQTLYNSENLKIISINPNTFIHISYFNSQTYGKVPCNGLLYFNENEAVVFDTPTGKIATKELIRWINQVRKKKIKVIVSSHFHKDALSNLELFHQKNILSYATQKTISLAKENGTKILPQNSFEKQTRIKIGNTFVLAKYFGEGHTRDISVGYIPSEKILFGACLVKSINASKGNLDDANADEWSNTIENIKLEFPNLKYVVPGHGKFGGIELLDYTIKLFKTN